MSALSSDVADVAEPSGPEGHDPAYGEPAQEASDELVARQTQYLSPGHVWPPSWSRHRPGA